MVNVGYHKRNYSQKGFLSLFKYQQYFRELPKYLLNLGFPNIKEIFLVVKIKKLFWGIPRIMWIFEFTATKIFLGILSLRVSHKVRSLLAPIVENFREGTSSNLAYPSFFYGLLQMSRFRALQRQALSRTSFILALFTSP